MTKWIEMGRHTPRPDDTLTAIEQEGFGIVCAVLDYEGESVYRILNAVNAHDELLRALKDSQQALAHAIYVLRDDPSFATSIALKGTEERARVAVANAEGGGL